MNLGIVILNLKVTAAKCIEWLQAKTLTEIVQNLAPIL